MCDACDFQNGAWVTLNPSAIECEGDIQVGQAIHPCLRLVSVLVFGLGVEHHLVSIASQSHALHEAWHGSDVGQYLVNFCSSNGAMIHRHGFVTAWHSIPQDPIAPRSELYA